ncbi:MAG: hypothetical protein DRQ60_10865 [Gammaproteobacteria bacterium]|nr:MAG: hypothetical protein DRQ60_10865 [Gammaproteobacteria bacterium]
MDANLIAECADVLYREGRHLDDNDWDNWLGLFTEDSWWHIPMWVNEYEVTTDPQRELSLMWYPNRSGLEDRIFRIRTGASSASTPLPRTVHAISNVSVEKKDDGEYTVFSVGVVSSFRHKNHDEFYCRYEHTLRRTDDGQKICGKRTIVSNDLIPDIIDIYSV